MNIEITDDVVEVIVTHKNGTRTAFHGEALRSLQADINAVGDGSLQVA